MPREFKAMWNSVWWRAVCDLNPTRKLLREVSASGEQALSKARHLMAAGTNAVQTERERLRKLHEELNALAAVR